MKLLVLLTTIQKMGTERYTGENGIMGHPKYTQLKLPDCGSDNLPKRDRGKKGAKNTTTKRLETRQQQGDKIVEMFAVKTGFFGEHHYDSFQINIDSHIFRHSPRWEDSKKQFEHVSDKASLPF